MTIGLLGNIKIIERGAIVDVEHLNAICIHGWPDPLFLQFSVFIEGCE